MRLLLLLLLLTVVQPSAGLAHERHQARPQHASVKAPAHPRAQAKVLLAAKNDTTAQHPPSKAAELPDTPPEWLINVTIGTFVLLVVLLIWWLAPTISTSRQLQSRLRGKKKGEQQQQRAK